MAYCGPWGWNSTFTCFADAWSTKATSSACAPRSSPTDEGTAPTFPRPRYAVESLCVGSASNHNTFHAGMPPPLRGVPPPPAMNGSMRFGPPRGGPRGGPPPHRGGPMGRGMGGGSWQRASAPAPMMGGGQRAPQRYQQGRGGASAGPRWSPPKPMGQNNARQPPQVWQQQPPPQQQQQQSVWNTGSGRSAF